MTKFSMDRWSPFQWFEAAQDLEREVERLRKHANVVDGINVRLRKALDLARQDVREMSQRNERLREALEDHWDHDEPSDTSRGWCFACHQPLEQCSARQALNKEGE